LGEGNGESGEGGELTDMINKELLSQMISEKLVSVTKHPIADLWIYNYSPRVQYEKLWNEITLQTRGLILDKEMNVVAKPFGKFFNYEEHQESEIPKLGFDVFDKLDGSLGILYWLNDKPFIATRGSFFSEQAVHATQILNEKYSHVFSNLEKDKTYLFEIIYPQNRIVVDYGDMDDLILLTSICHKTGNESQPDIGFPLVKKYSGVNDFTKLREQEAENSEGFVVRFHNGFRLKMKYAEYVRLHRIITGVSNVAVWEYMKDGKSFDELLQKVPDEFYTWLTKTKTVIQDKFDDLYNQSMDAYKECYSENRKDFAIAVMENYRELSSVIFCIYNKKDCSKPLWQMCRPIYSKPFKQDEV